MHLKACISNAFERLNVECWIHSSSYMIVTTLIFKNDIDIILCHWLTLRQVVCSGEENESCIGRQTGEETYSILCQMGYIPALQLCGVVQSRNNILVLNKFSIYLFSIYFLKPTPKHNLFFVTINMYMSVPTTFELHVIYHNNVNRKNRKQKKILLRQPTHPPKILSWVLSSTVIWVWLQQATWGRSLPWSIIRK